ncbi:hypothetical protein GCM10028801_21160 [Nocardioides maradonensis]
MSSAAPNPSPSRLPRVAPRVAQRALQRARLTVVPRRRTAVRAPRVPFVMLISALLLGGVIGLLFFNTSMQQASFRETALSHQARDLDAQQEALQLQLDALRDPARIARLAQRMGMIVPTGAAGILDYQTGKISGSPAPAEGPGLPLRQAPATRPAGFPVATVTVTVPPTSTTTTKTGTDAKSPTNAKNAGTGVPPKNR